MKHPQFDLFGSLAERERALKQVERNAGDWTQRGLDFIAGKMEDGREVIGEDIRLAMTEAGLPPYDEHAWGMLINLAIKKGILRPIGKRKKMRDRRSHARKSDIYRIRAVRL